MTQRRVLVLVPVVLDVSGLAKRRTPQNLVELRPNIDFDYLPVKAGPALYDSYQNFALTDKCVGTRPAGLALDPVNFLGGKEDVVFPQFLKCGQKLFEMGAKAICLGSITMHEAYEFLARELLVKVNNPAPPTYKLAETVLDMGLSHSRNAYPSPSYLKLNLTRAKMGGAVAYDGED